MKIDDKLSQIFEMEPMKETIQPRETDIVPYTEKSEYVENDYEYVRNNMRELLSTSKNVLYDAVDIARQSESPRAFEVVGSLLKQIADMNQQLLDVHAQKQKLSGTSKQETNNTVTNNNAIFVGSTNELSKMIADMNKGN